MTTSGPHPDAFKLASITVTFNPELSVLEAQLRALPEGSLKIIFDNASRPELFKKIDALTQQIKNLLVHRSDVNVGLAGGINGGASLASEAHPGPEFVLLLDQDSEPQPGSIQALLSGFREIESGGKKPGCVGPLLFDPGTGLTHGFHQCSRWRWKRVCPPPGSKPVRCANLNGSGTLVRLRTFLELGGLDEPLFIDHVDTEWAFRVQHAGYSLWGIPSAVFTHRMGNESVRFWFFGWRLWPSRSPQRHFFLFRNAAILMRRSYVPKVWKVWAVLKLILTALVYGLANGQRFAQLSHMKEGVREGFKGRAERSI